MACSRRSDWPDPSEAARSVVLAGALLLGCGRTAPVPAGAPPVAVLPFDFSGGLIYLRGVVNRDSAWLILDTGTSRTGIDREWARAIGVVPVMTPGAAETVSVAVVDTMRLGALELGHLAVALYPLRAVSEASGRQAWGFLGHDLLEQFTLEIDYREQRVRLYDPDRYRYTGSGTVVSFAAEGDHPLVRADVTVPGRGSIPARLLVDTGASGLCLILTVPFVERHGLARVPRAIDAPIGTGLAGPLRGKIVRLQRLRLAGLSVAFPTTGLGTERTGFLARTDFDGVIGNSLFDGSRLIVDYARRRVIVERAASAATRCDFDMSGLRLIAAGPDLRRIVVDYVVPQSPAADAGIQIGDELLRIDGRPVGAGKLGELNDVRQTLRVEGAARRIVLKRAADTVRVTLQLRRLL